MIEVKNGDFESCKKHLDELADAFERKVKAEEQTPKIIIAIFIIVAIFLLCLEYVPTRLARSFSLSVVSIEKAVRNGGGIIEMDNANDESALLGRTGKVDEFLEKKAIQKYAVYVYRVNENGEQSRGSTENFWDTCETLRKYWNATTIELNLGNDEIKVIDGMAYKQVIISQKIRERSGSK